jgi:hypothetical protein
MKSNSPTTTTEGYIMTDINYVVVTALDNRAVRISPNMLDSVNVLENCNNGGCASIKGYVPYSGYVVSPILNIQFISKFSNDRRMERRIAALEAITIADMPTTWIPTAKLKGQTHEYYFNMRKDFELASMRKTLNRDRSDAHRQGHDRCYVSFSKGISAHLYTAKGTDGLMHPILTDGLPTVESIMVSAIELNRTVIVEGEYKHVNSGAPKLTSNAINKLLNQRSVSIRKFSLKADNFDALVIDHNAIVPKDVEALMI